MKFHPRFWARLGGFLAGLAVSSLPAQIHFAPSNDMFAHRTDLGSVETARVFQPFVRASSEWGEPQSGSQSLWWQWTAPRDGFWEIVPDPDELAESVAWIEVFQGTELLRLKSVEDDGVVVINPYVLPSERRERILIKAKAGQVYQIRSLSGDPELPTLWNAAFILQPVTAAANRTVETRALLTKETEPGLERWSASAWGYHPQAQPPFVVQDLPYPDGVGSFDLYSPLWWEWTAPRAGWISLPSAVHYRMYRGVNPDPAQLTPVGSGGTYPLKVAAGETLLIVTGSTSFRHSVGFFDVRLTYTRDPQEETPGSQWYHIDMEELPLVIAPPEEAMSAEVVVWTWVNSFAGWIELDAPGLEFQVYMPSLRHRPQRLYQQGGKTYFWAPPVGIQLHVTGWPWPQGGQFIIRRANLPPPANDGPQQALDVGSGMTAVARMTNLGATWAEGEPFREESILRYPCVWFRWTAPVTSVAHVTGDEMQGKILVATGPDATTLTIVPDLKPSDSNDYWFHTEAGRHYWIALASEEGRFPLRLECAVPGTYDETHQITRVTELPWSAVSGAWALGEDNAPYVFFKTTALASAWISLRTLYKHGTQVWKGPFFETKTLVTTLGYYQQECLLVEPGETYWFAVVPDFVENPEGSWRTAFFSFHTVARPLVLPGDSADQAVDLGRQLPIHSEIPSPQSAPDAFEARLLGEGFTGSSAWFKWTAPEEVSAIYVASNARLLAFAHHPDSMPLFPLGFFSGENFEFSVSPGVTYFFFCYNKYATSPMDGYSYINIEPRYLEPSAYDAFATPSEITSYFSTEWSHWPTMRVFSRSVEEGEPLAMPEEPEAIYSAWGQWTAPHTGIYAIQSYERRIDQTLAGIYRGLTRRDVAAVYEGDEFSNLRRVPLFASIRKQEPVSKFNLVFAFAGYRYVFSAEEGKTYRIQAASPSSASGITLGLNEGDAYDEWVFNTPGLDLAQAAPDDNPSGDGWSNLLKFTLGLHPAFRVEDDPHPERIPRYTLSQDGREWQVRFWSDRFNTDYNIPEGQSSPGICTTAHVIAEVSEDLTEWRRWHNARSLGDNFWQVSLPLGDTPPGRFLRLKAQWCPAALPQ